MTATYWQKQTPDKPLFADLLWSRPENRAHAGKLLIIGGNAHGFAAPAAAFSQALQSGAGTVHVVLPDAIKKVVGGFFENAAFAPSTPSGSFSQASLDELLASAAWSDGVLVAGDLGRNSETAIVLEKLLAKHPGFITMTKDAVDYVTSAPAMVQNRADTTLVLSVSQLQRLGTALKFATPVTLGMSLLQLVDLLHNLTTLHSIHIITKHDDTIIVAVKGSVCTTPHTTDKETLWRVETATKAAVWWLQNPSKPFEALSTSIVA